MFTGIHTDICEQAWDMVLPGILAASSMDVTTRYDGCIVVLDPVSGEVFFTRNVKDVATPHKYVKNAHRKARLSQRTGMSSRQVQQNAPHLYERGDSKWGGSVVRHGLVVAFSGVQAVFDEMISGWMADAIIALCRHEMTREGGVMSEDYSFLGGD